jgi:hypothetical protein
LSAAARAVSERCGGLVWGRPWPCEYHAHYSHEPDGSSEPRESYELDKSYDSYELGGSDEDVRPD